jgi:hypothetical protein
VAPSVDEGGAASLHDEQPVVDSAMAVGGPDLLSAGSQNHLSRLRSSVTHAYVEAFGKSQMFVLHGHAS